jgi:hypothetical protein
MSKPFKSGLTASRKKRVRRRRRTARPDVDQWDAMDDHCFRLQMMAELLRACGEPLAPEVVRRIGQWVGEEAEQLQALLADAWKAVR